MKFYAALDESQRRCHVVASESDYLPDRTGGLTALCGENVPGTHGGPIRPSYHYFTAYRSRVVRYSHTCARCVKLHEKAS